MIWLAILDFFPHFGRLIMYGAGGRGQRASSRSRSCRRRRRRRRRGGVSTACCSSSEPEPVESSRAGSVSELRADQSQTPASPSMTPAQAPRLWFHPSLPCCPVSPVALMPRCMMPPSHRVPRFPLHLRLHLSFANEPDCWHLRHYTCLPPQVDMDVGDRSILSRPFLRPVAARPAKIHPILSGRIHGVCVLAPAWW